MSILSSIFKFLKGEKDAGKPEQAVSGRRGRDGRILYSIKAVREQALSDFRDIGVLARAYADERSRDSGALPETAVRHESRALIAAARRVGRFQELSSVLGTRYTIRTGESEVRMSQKEHAYYKIKNAFAKAHLKRHPAEFMLFEHVIHNILFPECRLEFLGVTEGYHEARLVYRQAAVCTEARPSAAQIANELCLRGLLQEGRYEFGNDLAFVTDVGQDGDNVLVDDDGRLRFIDPIIGFKPALQSLLADTSALESQIDQLVYKLYGLTEEEIAVVEGRGGQWTDRPTANKGVECGALGDRPLPRQRTVRPPAPKAVDDDEELE